MQARCAAGRIPFVVLVAKGLLTSRRRSTACSISSRRFRVDPDLRNAPTWGHFRYTDAMAQLKVRQLDDQVAAALKRRAESRGVSLEEEVRSILTTAVAARRSAMERRARALRKATGKPGSRALDSARTIRRERDANG